MFSIYRSQDLASTPPLDHLLKGLKLIKLKHYFYKLKSIFSIGTLEPKTLLKFRTSIIFQSATCYSSNFKNKNIFTIEP